MYGKPPHMPHVKNVPPEVSWRQTNKLNKQTNKQIDKQTNKQTEVENKSLGGGKNFEFDRLINNYWMRLSMISRIIQTEHDINNNNNNNFICRL